MSVFRTILKILAGFAIGATIGLLLSTLAILLFTDITFDEFISKLGNLNVSKGIIAASVGMASLLVSLFLLITIHEAGHLVCGLLTGYRFVSFRLFNFTLIRSKERMRIKRFAVAGTGGQCLLSPPDLPLEKIPVAWYNMGGIVANTLVLLAMLPLLWCHMHPFMHEFVVIFIIIDLILILTNGIPMQMGGIGNDAYNMLKLRKDMKSKRGLIVQLRSNAMIQEGVRPKDMPREWFTSNGEINYSNPLEVSVPLMESGILIDELKWEEAHMELKKLYSHKDRLMPLYTTEITCELVFTSLVTGRSDRARELYDTKLQRYIKTYSKVMSSKQRILCAVAIYMDNDMKKARSIYDTLLRDRHKYLLQGEVDSDLAIMKTLLHEA